MRTDLRRTALQRQIGHIIVLASASISGPQRSHWP